MFCLVSALLGAVRHMITESGDMTFIKTDEELADVELGMLFGYNHCPGVG